MDESNTQLSHFKKWLDHVESFPIVPGWQWTDKSWQNFSLPFKKLNIDFCRDEFGNVFLGAKTTEEWFSKIQKQKALTVLQAHMDHPGATLTKKIAQNGSLKRYAASVRGGLNGNLKGCDFLLYGGDGDYLETVLVDKIVDGFGEKIVLFKSESELESPVYLHAPSQTEDPDSRKISGWGLDNHMGCAAILSTIETNSDNNNILGLLTLDEETGNRGLNYVKLKSEMFGLKMDQWPVMLSLESPAEAMATGFVGGAGARWRKADKMADFDESLIKTLRSDESRRAVALRRGATEAGSWREWGGRVASLVVPCVHYHNATAYNEWRPEEMFISDVESLLAELTHAMENLRTHKDELDDGKTKETCLPTREVVIHNHVKKIAALAEKTPTYIDCLNQVIPVWNKRHSELEIAPVKFISDQWDAIRSDLISRNREQDLIQEKAEKALQVVEGFLGIHSFQNIKIQIHLVYGAKFNACHFKNGIALSVDLIEPDQLERVLIHELTHFLIKPYLQATRTRPIIQKFLDEGMACYATAALLDLSEDLVVGIDSQNLACYKDDVKGLKRQFKRWCEADLLKIHYGRHETIQVAEAANPFKVSAQNKWNRYGYVLAYAYFKKNLKSNGSVLSDLLEMTDSDVLEFMNA